MTNAVIVSGVAFLSAFCGWVLSHRWQKKQYRLAVSSERAQWNAGVRAWAADVVDVMIRLHAYFNKLEHKEAIERSAELAIALSVLVDRGRLYFPNVMRDQYGEDRQNSRQGYRSALLDPLVAAVKIAEGTRPEFDLPDPRGKFGVNRYSKALRLYLNAFLSLTERLLLVQDSHQELIERLRQTGDLTSAQRLERLLCPTGISEEPPGHRYWLGQEGGPNIPNERRILGAE